MGCKRLDSDFFSFLEVIHSEKRAPVKKIRISGYKYVYQYKDHLGNVRLTYADSDRDGAIDPASEIISEKNYYPFGLQQKGYNNTVSANNNSVAQNFGYNGKEFDQSLDMNTFDLGARHMDPALGRFMVIDPMTDFFNNQSPYAMANNNSVGNVDYYGFGIINGIGAIFRKLGNGIKKLFSGNNCSCASSGESIAQSFRRPDNIFPRRKRKKKRAREAAPSHRTRTGPLYGVRSVGKLKLEGISLAGAPDITAGSLASSVPVITPPAPRPVPPTPRPVPPIATPSPNAVNEEENVSAPAPIIDINFNIPFRPDTTFLKDKNGATKILRDLIMTLKEYPQMKVIIEGSFNSRIINVRNPTLNTPVNVNGGRGPIEWLTGGRANAIIKILEGQGVNPSQLVKGKGIIGNSINVNIRTKN